MAQASTGQDGVFGPQGAFNPLGNGRGRARVGHQLAKQSAQQEHREKGQDVIAQGPHEGLGVNGQQQHHVARQDHGQRGHQRRQQQHGVAPVRQEHQQQQRNNNR
mgnify:CR=1 FL=1